jgi:hypothetical protein
MMMMGNDSERSELQELQIDEEDHDGWGPIRPRRSSMPPDHHAADLSDRDTVPIGEPPAHKP